MNTNAFRRITASAAVAVAVFAISACGSEISPPSQDIGVVVEKDTTAQVPERTTGNRVEFDDEYGQGKAPERTNEPAGSGTRNRMDFAENHGR